MRLEVNNSGCMVEKNITKILFIRLDALGDALLASSMLPHLKKKYQYAQITVLCQKSLAALYKHCPFVETVISLDKKQFMLEQSHAQNVLQTLQSKSFDLAINAVYSRELKLDALATAIGARHSVAFKIKQRRGRWDFTFRYNRGYSQLVDSPRSWKPEIERYADFLAALGVIIEKPLAPQVWTGPEDEQFADNFFKTNNLDQQTTIAFFAGALSEHRLYKNYGQALQKVFAGTIMRSNGSRHLSYGLVPHHERKLDPTRPEEVQSAILKDSSGVEKNVTVIALGAATDYDINQFNLANSSLRTINLSGTTTLLQAAAILKRCRLAFGTETGLAHMACAVGIPHVILLGGGHFGRFIPYSPLTSSVILPLACFGCDWRCRYKKTHCVQDVHPDVLAYALQETLRSTSAKPRLFVQSASDRRGGLCNPRWQMPKIFLDMQVVDVIMVQKE